jgi:hypothetical protein
MWVDLFRQVAVALHAQSAAGPSRASRGWSHPPRALALYELLMNKCRILVCLLVSTPTKPTGATRVTSPAALIKPNPQTRVGALRYLADISMYVLIGGEALSLSQAYGTGILVIRQASAVDFGRGGDGVAGAGWERGSGRGTGRGGGGARGGSGVGLWGGSGVGPGARAERSGG